MTKQVFCDIVRSIMADDTLAGTAALFLALADPTRLRLLNLMCEREVCVSSFTSVLGQSQPLVSRHLAYLRNAGVVDARRDGKWIYYSVSANLDDNSLRLVTELFKWMKEQPALSEERSRYYASIGIDTAMPYRETQKVRSERPKRARREAPIEENRLSEVPEDGAYDDPDSGRTEDYGSARHNELEDFLL